MLLLSLLLLSLSHLDSSFCSSRSVHSQGTSNFARRRKNTLLSPSHGAPLRQNPTSPAEEKTLRSRRAMTVRSSLDNFTRTGQTRTTLAKARRLARHCRCSQVQIARSARPLVHVSQTKPRRSSHKQQVAPLRRILSRAPASCDLPSTLSQLPLRCHSSRCRPRCPAEDHSGVR